MGNILTPLTLSKKIVLLVTGFIGLGILLAYAAQSYRVANGTNQTINEWSTSRKVTNSCGADLFVPTNSSTEWTTFINNKPACVTIASAGTNCTYTTYWGSCSTNCGVGTAYLYYTITVPASGGGTCPVSEGQYANNSTSCSDYSCGACMDDGCICTDRGLETDQCYSGYCCSSGHCC